MHQNIKNGNSKGVLLLIYGILVSVFTTLLNTTKSTKTMKIDKMQMILPVIMEYQGVRLIYRPWSYHCISGYIYIGNDNFSMHFATLIHKDMDLYSAIQVFFRLSDLSWKQDPWRPVPLQVQDIRNMFE